MNAKPDLCFGDRRAGRLHNLVDNHNRSPGRRKQPYRTYHGEAGDALLGRGRRLKPNLPPNLGWWW
jgi:hypothetical protein